MRRTRRTRVLPLAKCGLRATAAFLRPARSQGRSLGDVWPELAANWTGESVQHAPRIPLLVKFIFPEDKLSVQVHPDDEYARVHEPAAGGVGKTEIWYVVEAGEGAQLRLGLESGITPEAFQSAIAAGSTEHCLKPFDVRAGDAFFVPAGTPHAIGPGMVLCEVQENSDLTYRIFDYNRVEPDGSPRPLHIRKALDVLNFRDHCESRVNPVEVRQGPLLQTYFAACRHFALERWIFSEPVFAATSPARFELLITLSGAGRVRWGSESVPYDRAQVWLLPAGLGSYELAPNSPTTLLRTYPPDLDDFGKQLTGQHIAKPVWSRLVHL